MVALQEKTFRPFVERDSRYLIVDESQAKLKIFIAGESASFVGRCLDISESGARFVHECQPVFEKSLQVQVGDLMTIEIAIPFSDQRLQTMARVMRVEDVTPQWASFKRTSVAINFYKIDGRILDMLRQSLLLGLEHQARERWFRQWSNLKNRLVDQALPIAVVVAGITAAMIFLFALSSVLDPNNEMVAWGQKYFSSKPYKITEPIFYRPNPEKSAEQKE